MRTIDEIYHEMLGVFEAETGMKLAGTGDLAVRLYAVAAQVHALEVQNEWTLRQCFPQTADGEYLERHAALRGLSRRGALAAAGTLRFSVTAPGEADLPIPAGTVCMTAGLVRFETTEEAALTAGNSWVDVRAAALEAGSAGNVAAGTVRTMAVAPTGVAFCTNPADFSGGADAEGEGELRARVLETFKRLPNGANAAFYEQEALSFSEVAAAKVLPRNRGIGTVDVVAATMQGIPGAELLAALEKHLEARREIAVDVGVLAPEPVSVAVAAQIAVRDGCDGPSVLGAAREAVSAYFCGKRLGEPVLRAKLGELIFSVDGVENYRLLEPAGDLTISSRQLPLLSTLTLEEMP